MAERAEGLLVVAPGKGDPRWYQALFLISFVVFALSSPSFTRRPEQLAASFATGIVLSAWLAWRRSRVFVVPFGALISAFGVVLLCNSHFIWPYAAVSGLSILSREYLRVDGRHVFNPTNFGMTVCLLFASGWMTATSSRWGGSPESMLVLACLGTLVVVKANRLDVSLSYVAGWLLGSLVYAAAAGLPLAPVLAPFTGASFQLFTFFMVTDPVTTPSTRNRRIVFGLAVGLMENLFRFHQSRNAHFYSLFLVTGFVPVFEAWLGRVEQSVWRPVEWRIGGSGRKWYNVAPLSGS